MSDAAASPFDQVVFAGGGNRCWWQAGGDTVAPELGLRPRVIAGLGRRRHRLYAHDSRETLAYYREVLADNRSNAYWGNLLRGKRVFPHFGIYRAALLTLFGQERLARLGDAPRSASGWPTSRAGAVRAWRWRRACWPTTSTSTCSRRCIRAWGEARLPPRIRAGAGLRHARGAGRPAAAVVLHTALHAGAAPRRPRGTGRRPVDNVPVDALDDAEGDVLVLVTRLYPRPPRFVLARRGQRRLYLQPSQRVPVSSWDYTRPEGMELAYALGRRDGEAFLREWPAIRRHSCPPWPEGRQRQARRRLPAVL